MNVPKPRPWPPFPDGRPLLGANGIRAMLEVLEGGGARLVDYLKVGPFIGLDAAARLAARLPLMLHMDFPMCGDVPPTEARLEAVKGWLDVTGAPWTSAHIICLVPGATQDEAADARRTVRAMTRERALENVARNARALVDALPVPLLLENQTFFPDAPYVWVYEASFVREALEWSGCGLLLDLAHARASADVLGVEVHAYLEELPLERTVEMHLNGPRRLGELSAERQARIMGGGPGVSLPVRFTEASLVDAHESPREEDYALLAWVLGRCRPRAITLEYDREPGPLREHLERLGAMIGR